MSQSMMFSLFIFAFLIFMVIVLLYIKKTVREEINKVRLQMIIKFSTEYGQELYNFTELNRQERVEKVLRLMENIMNDWNLDINYNKWKVEHRIRKLV